MDKTPNARLRKLSCRKPEAKKNETIVITQLDANSCPTSTPIRSSVVVDSENDDSPAFPRCTQECDDVAVIWDWNSPQAKQKVKKKPRKLCTASPRPTFKRHPSNNQQLIFDKLKEEFEALREQIAIPDNEECLALSPLEEADFKNDSKNKSAIDSLIQNENPNVDQDFEDIFNDSLDQELFLCTQKVENVLNKPETTPTKTTPIVDSHKRNFSDTLAINKTLAQQSTSTSNYRNNNNLLSTNTAQASCNVDDNFNDSLNMVFEAVQDKDIEILSQCDTKEKKVISLSVQNHSSLMRRTHSDMQVEVNRSKIMETETGKMEILRTHSFESSKNNDRLPPDKLREIERKRQEALAKLESKRKKVTQETKDRSTSPPRCSPDEIEQKRLQAIAKLEAKRKQELEIERKRQEALKRLEQNRMKRSFGGRGTYTKRL